VVVTVTPDVIAVKAEANDEGDQAIHGQIVEVPAKSVKKRFEIGEHVKVLSGRNVNASGMVVEVVKDVVTIMSDQGEQEVSL
jgi:transcription elongation factor SPT5